MRNELRLSIILIALICFIVFSNKSRAGDGYGYSFNPTIANNKGDARLAA